MNDLHVASQTLAPQTSERRALLRALRALQKGDFTVRMPLDMSGSDREVAQAFNDVVEMNQSIADELARICRDVGRAGQINQRMRVAAVDISVVARAAATASIPSGSINGSSPWMLMTASQGHRAATSAMRSEPLG